MKKTINSRNIKIADISEDFSKSKLPDQAAALSVPSEHGEAVALFNRPLADLIRGGMSGARAVAERDAYPGLRELVKRYMPWVPADFADRLNLPAFYYLEHYMAKVTKNPQTGQDVLFVILAREKDAKTKQEVFTIFDLTNQKIKRVEENDPLFDRAKTIHINAEQARLQHLNTLAKAHDDFIYRLEQNPNAGGITAWCPMVLKAIRVAEDRNTVMQAHIHATQARQGGAKGQAMMAAEDRARAGEDTEFQKALSDQGFFKDAEHVIVHVLERYGKVDRMDELASRIRGGALQFPQLVANLSRRVPQAQAQQMVDGMIAFIADIADRIKDKYDQDLAAKKTRQQTISTPQQGAGERPNIPETIGEFTIEDMPAWVHGRLQGYAKMENYESQGGAMQASIDAEVKALASLIDGLRKIHINICQDGNFPKNRAALQGNPAAIQEVSNAKQVLLDYFQKYSSSMFVLKDKDTGAMRIDKRRIGSGQADKAIANLELGIYLVHMTNKLDAMGF